VDEKKIVLRLAEGDAELPYEVIGKAKLANDV
jgi:hypothetical protein